MPNYFEMYKTLFRAQTEAIEILQRAQQAAEEMYVSSKDPDVEPLENLNEMEPDKDKK